MVAKSRLILALTLLAASAHGGWRGDGTGVFPRATPPIAWSATSNVVWKTPLPSWGNGGPVLECDRVFVCSEPASLFCITVVDGKVLWRADSSGMAALSDEDRKRWDAAAPQRKELAALRKQLQRAERDRKKPAETAAARDDEGFFRLVAEARALEKQLNDLPNVRKAGGHAQTGGTTPTPTVDMEANRVYVFYAPGIVAAHSFGGDRQWARAVKLGSIKWGHTSSPLLLDDKLIICHGATTALNPDTGEQLWTVPSRARHGSPIPCRIGETDAVVTPGGECIRVSDGTVLCKGLPSTEYNAPVVHDDVVYVVGLRDTVAVAYRLPDAEGEDAEKLWETPIKKGRYFASPVVHNGLVFGIRQSGTISVLDAASGELLKEKPFPPMHQKKGQCYPPLAVAGEYLFAFSDNGTTLVLEPTKDLTLVSQNHLERTRSAPIFSGSRIYLHGMKHLWCLGE